MTLPAVIRVFFAVDLAPPLKASLGSFITTLKKKSKPHSIRWSKPENLHITLQFLAEVQAKDVPILLAEVRAQCAKYLQTAHFSLGEVQLFLDIYRPRVIVMEIAAQEELAVIAQLIGQGVVAAQYSIEDRPFRAQRN